MPSARRCGGERLGEPSSRVLGQDNLIQYTDRHRAVDAAGDARLLGYQMALQRIAFVISGGSEPFAVQDPDRRLRTHDRDL